jgi:hypothetical protein
MFIDKDHFDASIKRIIERINNLESNITPPKTKERPTINGELLFDNQDLCLMLNVCKRTLQSYRSMGKLPSQRIKQKTYYLESDVMRFIKEYLK